MHASARGETAPVLALRDLIVELRLSAGAIRPVDGLSFEVHPGETVALVGESGCGKTMTALSVLGLLPRPGGRIAGGSIEFEGRDLVRASARELRRIRGSQIAMIFQQPQSALNPVFTVGKQITDVIRAHSPDVSRRDARERAVELLARVGVPEPAARVGDYPSQWSGGMCQRALIAMAIANRPSLLIADEPTTALDVTVQAQVLDVLREAQRDTGAATLLITHDLGVVAEMADRVIVMYAGRLAELAATAELITAPRHPYTLGLLTSLPRLDTDAQALLPIAGVPPQPHRMPSGCAFHPRCTVRDKRAVCAEEVPPIVDLGQRSTACHFHHDMPGAVSAAAAQFGQGAVFGD